MKNSSYFISKILLCAVMMTALIVSPNALAQITQKAEFGKFALTNGSIHTITDGSIENGTLLINGHRIEAVDSDLQIPDGYQIIDLKGGHVYPGFIDTDTRLGLVEISAVPVTVDHTEIGNFNPQMRAFTAINPNSVAIPVTRVSGVTTVISSPASGVISGKSTLIDLFGYSPDSMAVRQDAALNINWPTSGRRGWGDQRSEEERLKAYRRNIRELQNYWDQAEAYHRMWEKFEANPSGKRQPEKNAEMEGMRDIFRGKLPVMIAVDRERDIRNTLEWISEQEYDDIRFILTSVAEGWRVADEIADAGIPVVVGPMFRTPARAYDNYQRPYQNPGLLAEAGVTVAIRSGDTENARNLPFNAGFATAYGMDKQQALEALTIIPARIFGVEDEIGSLEPGKRATLFISDGDPFEPLSSISQVFINGYKIPMVSRQTLLYDEFLKRNP